jgi:hypothetical protein
MVEKRWLTKEEKQLLKPHAEHYVAMAIHIRDATISELERLHLACLACTNVNCGWDDYAAAQYLAGEITAEVGWRNRRDAAAVEAVQPTAHVLDRLADDGGRANDPQ